MKPKKGFTIVELLIVIVIIAILAAITIVAYNGMQNRARDSQLDSTAAMWIKALKLYQADKGYYPTNTQITDQTWATTNMTGVSKNMYTTIAAGSNPALISRDPVTSVLNDTTNYFATGYFDYRGSSSYTLNADGTFDNNSTACNSGSSCPTYVFAYRLSNGTLKYFYGS